MKIYKLHDHYYIEDAPTVTPEDFQQEITEPHIQHRDRIVRSFILLTVSNPVVHEICEALNWLREDDDGKRSDYIGYSARFDYIGYSARVDYTGRRTDEHRQNARQEVIEQERMKLPERIVKKTQELADDLNERIVKVNNRYTDYAMNVVPSAIRNDITFDNDSELEKPTERLEEINEKIDELKRQRKDVQKEIATLKNEIFVRDADPKEIFPKEAAPHIQKAMFSMAENNELFKPPNRSSFFG